MQNKADLQPLMNYDGTPFIVGVVLLVVAGLIVLTVLFITRKRKIRTLSDLVEKPPYVPDLTALRKKYIALLYVLEQEFKNGVVKNRELHIRLSALLREYVAEATGLPVRSMTLTDLKRTKHRELSDAVETYYAIEFAEKRTSDPEKAIALAREVIGS